MAELNQQRPARIHWRLVGVWVIYLVAILCVQGLTIDTFETSWTPGAREWWYRLPLIATAVIAVGCCVAAKWLVPLKDDRIATRAIGLVFSFLAFLINLAMWFFCSVVKHWHVD